VTSRRILGRSRGVFIDSSAFFAAMDRREADHAAAIGLLSALQGAQIPLFTSNFIRAEAHALVLARASSFHARNFLSALASGRIRLIQVLPEDEVRAIDIVMRYRDKEFSLTDATSFVVMERLGLRDAFSFDSDFSQYGFRTLPDT
jgi:uncharacterized protein